VSPLSRQDALRVTLEAFPESPVIVSLGTTSREVLAIGTSDHHLHVLDSMGLSAAIGLGVALGVAERWRGKVLVLEGDGGLLMGLSTLPTIGLLQPPNLVIAVFDDGVYTATGGQPTASAAVDFPAVARACGIEAQGATSLGELSAHLDRAATHDGPTLVHARIAPGKRSLPFYLPDPPVLTDQFVRYLRGMTPAGSDGLAARADEGRPA
jgi:thiamine pyrophosphate-dependent acetolactate synthase large subunit-like protein